MTLRRLRCRRWLTAAIAPITADWEANGPKWTLPLGGQASRVIRIGNPVNLLLGAHYNVVKPQYGADWWLRSRVTFIF